MDTGQAIGLRLARRNAVIKRNAKDINRGNRQIGHAVTEVLRPLNL